MATGLQRDDVIGIIGVVVLLVGTATGNGYVMLGLSLAAIAILAAFYRRRMKGGTLLVTFVAAVTAGVISFIAASQR